MKRVFASTAWLSVAAILGSAPSYAQTLRVPEMFSTIQSALDAAPPSAIVLVGPGTYRENLEIVKPVTLRSSEGPRQTILDGKRAAPVIVARGSGSDKVTIDGFTITNGLNNFQLSTTTAPGQAAGIFLDSVVAVVTDNVIRDNMGCVGSGVSTLSASLSLQRNHIVNNPQDPGCDGADGGGVFLRADGAIASVIANNIIAGHRIGGYGAGVAVQGLKTTVTIRENIIRSNVTASGGFGGAILINQSSAHIAGNLMSGNGAELGGAVALFPDVVNRVTLQGNLMLNNTATAGGSAAYLSAASTDSLRMTANLLEGSTSVSLVECSFPYAIPQTNLLRNSVGPELGGACTRTR